MILKNIDKELPVSEPILSIKKMVLTNLIKDKIQYDTN